ncbi:MAG: S8 family peptidase, partial [Sphingobacteriales bacterium]
LNKGSFRDGSYLINSDSADVLIAGQLIKSIEKKYPEYHFLQVKLTRTELAQLISDENVNYIQSVSPKPVEELQVNGFDNSVNKINLVHNNWPLLNGTGTTVSIKENLFDTSDIDFKGRILKTAISSPINSSHASYMATIIGGAGNSYYTGKGAAWSATLSSSDFANLMPDNNSFFQQNNITLQNHSYGTAIENFYGAEAAAYDVQANSNTTLLHVFSVGNKGTDAGTQNYAGINGFANTTGNFKMAKNILTAGHIDSFGTVLPLSSRGPAFDGRVKPELVAYAEDGSSGAAAIVSGVSLLAQQAYKDINGTNPPSALIKAVLLNSADDVGPRGIDFNSGYGSVNAYKAIKTIKEDRILTGIVANGNTLSLPLSIPFNAVNLKITLSWNDPAAAVNTFKALVNDLDLQIIYIPSSTIYKPWVLNSSPNTAALNELPVQKRDSLNNTEQITIDNPLAGDYSVNVNGFNIPSGTQSFYIAYQWDTLNHFKFTYPTGSDNIFSNQNNLLRWENTYTGTGKLEYSINNGTSWNLINNSVNLMENSFYWAAPDTFTTALLKMTIGSDNYLSDTFSVSHIIPTGVGFNCTDSAMIYWRKIKGVNSYTVFSLGNKYLQPFSTTADTFLIIKKTISPALHYTVSPDLSSTKNGVKSYTFNYTTQGVDCYLRNFLVDLNDKSASIQVGMGTIYQVKSICIEKIEKGNYECIKTFIPYGNLDYSFIDNILNKGGNIYRVKIELLNGQLIYGFPITLYYFDSSDYLLFPNPVKREEGLTILSNTLKSSVLQIFSVTGQLVHQQLLNNYSEKIFTAILEKGLYIYSILRDNKIVARGKIMVQ